MEHRKLDALMTPVERIARVAAAGVNLAKAPQTAPSGAISLDNADGTRTIIGEVVNGESNPSYTMATHVGDTTPPGVPTGITATSKSGVVVVEWDGTLSGGIPDDFFCVRIYLDGAELGALTEAGSVASAKLDGGTTVSITATSEDDCCLPDGTPDHNVSAASQAISVTVAASAAEIIVDVEDEIQGIEQEITDFKGNTYTKAETDKKVQDLDDEISTELTTNYYNKTQIDTNYATKTLVAQTKEEIELSASQTYATKGAGNPNLSPFYAHDLSDVRSTDNPDGYWYQRPSRTTQLEDGWAHIVMDNSSGSGTMYAYMMVAPDAAPAVEGTMLVEVRNLVTDIAAEARQLWWNPQQASADSIQVHGDMVQYWWEDGAKYFDIHPTGAASPTTWSNMWFAVSKGRKAEFDARISYYANTEATIDGQQVTLPYEGSFKPYVTGQESLAKTYATNSALTVGLDGVRSEVSQTYSTKQQTADAIEAIQVGGRNLITLAETYNGSVTSSGGDYGSDTNYFQRRSGYIPATAGETYQMQVWGTPKSGYALWCCIAFYDSSKALVGTREASYSDVGATYHGISAVAPSGTAYMRVAWTAGDNGHAKLEQGTLPTDYTAAPEDLVARTNLTPFGSHALDDVYDAATNQDGYWAIRPNAAYITQLGDGWLHFERTNTGTRVVASNMATMPMPDVGEDELLTVLIEVRNNQSTAPTSGTPNNIYVHQFNGAQLWGNTVQTSNITNDSAIKIWLMGESFEKRLTKVTDSAHKTGDYTRGFSINVQCGIGQTLSFDFRLSVYKGGYEGGYLPYSIEDTTLSKTYTKSSTFVQTVDGLDGRITATEDGLAVQETLIRQYAGGVLVAYTGNTVGALVNAAGQYDIVSLTWQDGEPTVGTTLSTFTATDLLLGLQAENALISLLGGTGSISASTDWTEGEYGMTVRGPGALAMHTGSSRAVGISMEKTFERRIIDPTQPPTAADSSNLSIDAPRPTISYGSDYRLVFAKKLWDETSKEYTIPGDYVHLTVPDEGVFGTTGLQVGGFHDGTTQWPSGTSMRGIFFGSKIINPNGAAYGTLFTQAECVSNFGRKLSQAKDVVLVMNGDTGVYSGQMTASLNSSSEVRVYMSPTRSGATRINYLVVLGA